MTVVTDKLDLSLGSFLYIFISNESNFNAIYEIRMLIIAGVYKYGLLEFLIGIFYLLLFIFL